MLVMVVVSDKIFSVRLEGGVCYDKLLLFGQVDSVVLPYENGKYIHILMGQR